MSRRKTTLSYLDLLPHAGRDVPALLAEQDFRGGFPAEGDHVEFKQGISTQRVEDAMVAFSNHEGGVIFIGVAPDGSLHDRLLDGEMAARLHAIARHAYDIGRYDLHQLVVGERRVIAVGVARRHEGVAQTSAGVPLVRRGAMNVPLIGSELATLVNLRRLEHFERTVTTTSLDDVVPRLVDRVAEVWHLAGNPATRVDRLVECGLVDGSRRNLTVAGALYLLLEPQEVVTKAYVELLRYRPGEIEYEHRVEIRGPLDHQVEEATTRVMEVLGAELVILGARRYELPRLPEVVVREAVANAVAHRSYEAAGTPIRIEIRPDAVTIASPGPLPEPVTVENMREQAASRNEVVMATLRRFGLAEELGRGVDVMQDTMQAQLLDPPQFSDTGSSVVVTLPLGSTVTSQERAWINEVEHRGQIRAGDRILLIHAARGEVLTNQYVRDLLGVDSVEARAALQRLRDAGFVAQSGERGGAQYRLSGDLKPPPGLRLDDRQLGQLVLDLAAEGPVTNELVRERTGLDRAQALSLLTDLVAQGLLVRFGQRRGTRYLLSGEHH